MKRNKRETKCTTIVQTDQVFNTLQRKRRAAKRAQKRKNCEGYSKRKWATDRVCRYILFPVTLTATGHPNDFYLHALSLCWNNKNISKDYRCQQLLRGLRLQSSIGDLQQLKRSLETGWFLSSRKHDLARIGQVAGYFLQRYARSIGQALDEKYDPLLQNPVNDKELNDLIGELKDGRTVVPVVVKLELSAESYFNASKFVSLNEYQVDLFTTGEEIIVTSRVKLLKITAECENLAWSILNSASFAIQEELIRDVPSLTPVRHAGNSVDENHMLSIDTPIDNHCGSDESASHNYSNSIDNAKSKNLSNNKIPTRTHSNRVKKNNNKYSSEAFVLY